MLAYCNKCFKTFFIVLIFQVRDWLRSCMIESGLKAMSACNVGTFTQRSHPTAGSCTLYASARPSKATYHE